jgi:hypothetical protein
MNLRDAILGTLWKKRSQKKSPLVATGTLMLTWAMLRSFSEHPWGRSKKLLDCLRGSEEILVGAGVDTHWRPVFQSIPRGILEFFEVP